MVRTLLAFCCAPLLLSCATPATRPIRFVDCTHGEYCGALDDWPDSAWTKKHESLYHRGLQSILQEMACGTSVARGRRLAYVADDDVSVSCAAGGARLRHVKDRNDANRLLAAGHIDYVVEFERANASRIRGGIEVPLSASYYGKSRRTGGDARLEGMDNFVIVQTETTAEVRLVSRAVP